MTTAVDVDRLRSTVPGGVVTPGDHTYDEARAMWNGDLDRRPSAIVRCGRTEDVVTCLGVARAAGMRVTVRGGGHGSAGAALGDDALVVDLGPMNRVTVDPVARRAVVEGGARLADVDAATQAHGLAVPTGLVSHTGIGGLTLGGGMGWLTRLHGLTIDNLVAAEVVTADGLVRRVDAEHDPDLFWALRGGGAGFGVVTRLDLALHPVDPTVDLAVAFFAGATATEALHLVRDLTADLPPRLNLVPVAMHAPPEPWVPEEHRFAPGWALILVGFGDPAGHAAVVSRVQAAGPTFAMTTPMPYVALQQMIDDGPSAWGIHSYDQAAYLDLPLTDACLDVLARGMADRGPLSIAPLYLLDGAYSAVPEAATAFGGGRSPRFSVFLIGGATDSAGLDPERRWARELRTALEPVSLRGGYLNSVFDPAEEERRAAYGDKLDRLERIRSAYDPDGLFAPR